MTERRRLRSIRGPVCDVCAAWQRLTELFHHTRGQSWSAQEVERLVLWGWTVGSRVGVPQMHICPRHAERHKAIVASLDAGRFPPRGTTAGPTMCAPEALLEELRAARLLWGEGGEQGGTPFDLVTLRAATLLGLLQGRSPRDLEALSEREGAPVQ